MKTPEEIELDKLRHQEASYEKMLADLNEKRSTSKFKKKMERQPEPTINSAFTDTLANIRKQIENRIKNDAD